MKQITNYSIKRNAVIAIIGLSFLVSGCMEDVYDPNYRTPVPDELKDLQAPTDFDWSITKNIDLNVNVNDEYEGKYYYEVSVYDSNPFFDENAQLLTKGLAKKDKSFSAVINIPQSLEQIFIVQSMKIKDGSTVNAIRNISTDTPTITCDFSNNNFKNSKKVKSLNIHRQSSNNDNFDVPSNAISIEGSKTFTISANTNYVIKEGTIFNGDLRWEWCQNTNIYVMGTLAPKNAQEINGKCTVYIGENGTFQSSSLLINSNSGIINKGIIDIGKIRIDNSGSFIYNHNQLITNTLILTSDSKFRNYCYSDIKEILDIQGNTVIVGEEGLLRCKNLQMNNSVIELGYNAIAEITNEASFTYKNTIQANESGAPLTALLKLHSIKEVGWNGLNLTNRLQVLLEKYNSRYDKSNYIDKENSVTTVTSAEEIIQIPASGCNKKGNNINQSNKEPEGSTFPIIVSPDNSYTFVMEDNWPVYGDYDMNDLVMDIELEYEEEENGYINELEIEATLRAVGASKSLAAAIQLDKVPVTAIEEIEFEDIPKEALDGSVFDCINGLEKDQQYAVIPFFDNAHRALGVKNGTLINTGKEDYRVKKKEFEIEIKFKANTVKQEDINIKNLNFFIVTDGKKQGRKEVHLRGFQPTQRASRIYLNSNSDNYDVAPYLSKDNLIWGLMLPSYEKKRFNYPKENKNIKDAYPKFADWAVSGGTTNTDWYKPENAQKGYIYNN